MYIRMYSEVLPFHIPCPEVYIIYDFMPVYFPALWHIASDVVPKIVQYCSNVTSSRDSASD